MTSLFITADRKRFVWPGDPEAAFGVAAVDIDRLGLRDAYDDFIKPKPKAMPKPSDKMARKPRNKGRF